MGVGVALEFLAGRYHANPWGRHVNEGAVEWPPSPWRLLRALVDIWYREGRPDEAAFLKLLEGLREAPEIYVPPSLPGRSCHYLPGERFLRWGASPGEKDWVTDAFRVLPERGRVVFWWEKVELEAPARELLSRLAACLTYFGRVESWCRAEVVSSPPDGEPCRPGGSEGVRLVVPNPRAGVQDLLKSLSEPTGRLRKQVGRVLPKGAREEVYSVPRDVLEPRRSAPVPEVRYEVVRFALGGPVLPPVTEAVAVGYAFREAAMAWYGRLYGGGNAPHLSGRGEDGRPLEGHRHAHYLPTDEDGDGRLDHLTVWCPGGLGKEEVGALERVAEVYVPELDRSVRAMRVAVGMRKDFPGVPLFQEAKEWVSFTPFLPVRHPRRRGGEWRDTPEDQAALEAERRGLDRPEVVRVRGRGRPWNAFRRWHRGRGVQAGATGYGFRLRFPREVQGPIALGYGAHYGLGLFLPDPSKHPGP